MSRVDELTIGPGVFPGQPQPDWALEVFSVRASSGAMTVPAGLPEHFFPLIDVYGQFIHTDWPAKIHVAEDFARRCAAEAGDLAAHGGPAGWDALRGLAGWSALRRPAGSSIRQAGETMVAGGPRRAAFLVARRQRRAARRGHDADQRPRHWFQDLPERSSPLGRFYGRLELGAAGILPGQGVRRVSLQPREPVAQIWAAVGAAIRGHGAPAPAKLGDEHAGQLVRRPRLPAPQDALRGGRACQVETPWKPAAAIGANLPTSSIPSFREALEQRMSREHGASAGDRWCIGYFVDNELGWGDELSLALATLASPAGQAAKQAFVADLKRKYGGIDELNRAWGTAHVSWNALGESRQPPDAKRAHDDLAAFATRLAEQYFRTCREAVKRFAPHNLYLGCRFAAKNDRGDPRGGQVLRRAELQPLSGQSGSTSACPRAWTCR